MVFSTILSVENMFLLSSFFSDLLSEKYDSFDGNGLVSNSTFSFQVGLVEGV